MTSDTADHNTGSDEAAPVSQISVIMPVYNGEEFLPQSLPPLVAMLERGVIAELIVVDDSSDDASAAIATRWGARVVPSGGRLGPAAARNAAAAVACGDILWFVDADVIVHDSAPGYLQDGFSDRDVVAVFGSYDDRPPAENFFSQYKNLVHHYYHQRASAEAKTFWAGCGAVRKSVFLDAGGFDIEHYKQPSIEDIELGARLSRKGGRILLLREMQCTHLKVWHFSNLIRTEVFLRAIPWSRLILSDSGIPDDLNVGYSERLRAILAALFVCVILGFLFGVIGGGALALATLLVTWANREIGLFFLRQRGLFFALRAVLFHQVYYLYSSAAFVWALLENGLARVRKNTSTSVSG